jgi:predicted RNA-binding Zn-ribbon protein involved in translation (DUF1610 family)
METNNYVSFKCPECANEVEAYAKVPGNAPGPFNETSVPKMIADSIIGNTIYCPKCGDRFTIMLDTHASMVPLFLRRG